MADVDFTNNLKREEDLLFIGQNIRCRTKTLHEGWGESLVYRGYFKWRNQKEEIVVIKKIKKIDCSEKWEDMVNYHIRETIKHENVLKIISFEETDEWRFFALARYKYTLEEVGNGSYKGPLPSDAQVLCQVAEGLLYLHTKQCSHGNLTPRTILISPTQPMRMMIKLSEFGLSKFSVKCDDNHHPAESHDLEVNHFETGKWHSITELRERKELFHRKYWIFDGTADSFQEPTINQDIFAAGCVCYYFLERGVHPFGKDLSSILKNIKERNPVSLKARLENFSAISQEKKKLKFAYEPIKNMIGDPPTDGKNWLMIAKDSFIQALPLMFEEVTENQLGSGANGVVYRGTYEGNAVAVKRVLVASEGQIGKEQKREVKEQLRLDHENVLKLFHVDDARSKEFRYLAIELCAGTLKDFCEKKYKGPELPPDVVVLFQIANGLHYIHSRGLVHRDVKPDNILISMTTPVQMKLSDFGFVKKISPQGSFSQSGLKGTKMWMAPEMLELVDDDGPDKSQDKLPHGKIQSDTFAAGCVFFYFLTRGSHPFGNSSVTVPSNILENKPVELTHKKTQKMQDDHLVLYDLIEKMINVKSERIAMPEVIKQLTANLTASRQFKEVVRALPGLGSCISRFHLTEPVLTVGVDDQVILLSADNSSIPFSNWKEDDSKFKRGKIKEIDTMEWNVDGTQLAAIAYNERVVIVWSYSNGEILFDKNLPNDIDRIEWNPFTPNVFATFCQFGLKMGKKVFFFDSSPVNRPYHFCTLQREQGITSVQWISKSRVALGLGDGEINIFEMGESTGTAQIVKKFKHDGWIRDMVWDERTKCLAVCSPGFDGGMKIWSMEGDQPIHTLEVDGNCLSLAWRPNGRKMDDDNADVARKSPDNFIFASGLVDGRTVIWTPLKEEKIRFLNQHSSWVNSLLFSPDGRFLASADKDGKLVIWATENWAPVFSGEMGWSRSMSWMSPSAVLVHEYKITCYSYAKVRVIEYAVGQSETPF